MRFRPLLALVTLLGPATGHAAPPKAAPAPPVVTILGDSITAGLGLPAADALPAQLQAALTRRGLRAVVRGAGVSGDTTAGGLARVDFSVASDTRLCIVELGANDYLQSIPPEQTQRSLQAIVRRLKARHIRVLLAGGALPERTSGAYGRAFNAVFPAVAKAEGVALEADFLAGAQGRPDLKQADGLHPNAAGVRLIAARLAGYVAKTL
jgi:acyl-CoA thioesterase-1